MIQGLESLDRVIDKTIRDLGLGSDEIPYQDFVEWIADALEHIGSYYQFQEKECSILISDFEGHLPCDYYKPIRMIKGITVAPGEGGFYGGTLVSLLNKLGVDYSQLPAYERFHIIPVAGIAKADIVDTLQNRLNMNKNLIGNPSVNKFSETDYNINFNRINTSFRYGVIQLQYLAIPTDERGYPLVPTSVSFRDALFWKIAYHISMRNPKLLQNQRMQDMEYCKQKWNNYCTQARATANMPDLAGLERLKNNWLRLYNTTDDDATNYGSLGKQQMINFNGRN